MSALDWIDIPGACLSTHVIPGMTGSFNVTIGDAVSGTYGANHSHVYGGDIKLICDPEDWLAGKLSHKLPAVSGALFGIGGNASFVYAQETSALYGGPKVEIRRAHLISKTSSNAPQQPQDAPAGHDHDDHGAASPVDKVTSKAVTGLSILVIGIPAACEMLTRFSYGDSHDHMPEILKLGAVGLTSRVMEFIKKVEESCTWGDMAVIAADRGVNDMERAEEVVAGPFEQPGVVEELVLALQEDLEDANDAVVNVQHVLGDGDNQDDDAADLM